MKRDLVMGWVFIAMALLMVVCIVGNCVNANWVGLSICGLAFGLNIFNAVNHFRTYKMCKEYKASWTKLDLAIRECWSDEDEDEPEDNNIITD